MEKEQKTITNANEVRQNKLNVPTLRFGGFSDLWKKSTIEKNAKVYDGTHQTPIYTKSGVKFVSVENINDLYSSSKYISVDDYNSDFKYVPEINDILMTRIGDIGTPALVTKSEPLAYYVSLALLKEIDLEPLFLYHYIQTAPFQKELWRRTLHVAFPKKINKNEIGDCAIFYPSTRCEQKKIALFLDGIEKKIKIQNKIIEDLQVLKKELCNKIFNSSCCDSEIKVRGIARVYGGYAFSSKTYVDNGQYKIITIGNVTGEHFISGEYNTVDCLPQNIQEQQILDNGDILISLTGNVGRISLVKGNNFLLNQRVAKLVIEDKALKDYVYQYLSHSSFEKDMQNAGQGAAQKNIKNEDILSYDIRIPSEKATLDNIVKLFLTYDIKVEHETKIIDCLQRQKAYFLNVMFV